MIHRLNLNHIYFEPTRTAPCWLCRHHVARVLNNRMFPRLATVEVRLPRGRLTQIDTHQVPIAFTRCTKSHGPKIDTHKKSNLNKPDLSSLFSTAFLDKNDDFWLVPRCSCRCSPAGCVRLLWPSSAPDRTSADKKCYGCKRAGISPSRRQPSVSSCFNERPICL